MFRSLSHAAGVAAAGLALVACSPSLNWRSMPLDGAPVTATFPCKPDHAVRSVDWGQGPVSLAMAGCEADGATFAVSHMPVAQPAQASAVLQRWQEALQKQLHLEGTPPAGTAFAVPGVMGLPQSQRVQWQGRDDRGQPVSVDAVWFARLEGPQARVYHAVVLSPRPVGQAARDTFLQGMVMQ
ncbi:hypothetical protein GCM10027082_44710 [Comamonas humi]